MLKKPTQLTLSALHFTPAHLAVQEGVCSWCGAPVEVEREPVGSITVPNCGCRTVEEQDDE